MTQSVPMYMHGHSSYQQCCAPCLQRRSNHLGLPRKEMGACALAHKLLAVRTEQEPRARLISGPDWPGHS